MIKNKKGVGGTLLTLVAVTLIIALIILVFYVISFKIISDIWKKISGDTNMNYAELTYKGQNMELLKNYLSQKIIIVINDKQSEISTADLIRLYYKDRGYYGLLKENIINYLNKLEYNYFEKGDSKEKVRGFNLFINNAPVEQYQRDYVGGILTPANFESKNHADGSCIGVVGSKNCLAFGEITISSIDGKKLYIILRESNAAKNV